MPSMPIPVTTPYSDDSEGPVLRDFVNESIAQAQRSPSQRSELLSEASHSVNNGTVEQHRRHHRGSPGPYRDRFRTELVHSDASPNELLHRLMERTQETNTLRSALRIAVERIDSETQRTLALERTQSQVAERFRVLNENRIAAQQEAIRATHALRSYEFQLQNAQDEIARAQEVLRMVESQRDEAEEAAARAKMKARQLHQERVVAAAREEGRRYGFEAGLRKAQEEQTLAARQQSSHNRHVHRSAQRQRERNRTAHAQTETEEQQSDAMRGTFDQMSRRSPPSHLPSHEMNHINSPEVVRVTERGAENNHNHTSEPGPSSPSPPPPLVQSQPPPSEPVPIVHPEPDIRSHSPAVQLYSLEIPPATELEQHFNLNEYPGKHPQPWVTAQQHLEMSSQQASPENAFQLNSSDMDIQRNVTFSQPASQPNGNLRKGKESWYRTLSRRLRLGRKSKSSSSTVGPSGLDRELEPQSWYTKKPPPPIQVRDFGVPKPRSSMDSTSTRISQLDFVSPPNRTPDGSEQSFKMGGKLGRRFGRKGGGLSVINEDPASRTATPAKDTQEGTQNIDWPEMSRPIQNSLGQQQITNNSRYSNQRSTEEWKRSSADIPRELNTQTRPPSGPRRPVKLTVPAPLSLQNHGAPAMPGTSSNAGGSGLSRSRAGSHGLQRTSHQVTSPEPSPIKITVETPSGSPSDTLGSVLGSGRPESNHLSPRSFHSSNLRSTPGLPSTSSPPHSYPNGLGLVPNDVNPSDSQDPYLWNEHPSSSSTFPAPLHAHMDRSRDNSITSNTLAQSYPIISRPSRSPSNTPRPLPMDFTPDHQWVGHSRHRSATGLSPEPYNQPLPNGKHDRQRSADGHSVGSRRLSTTHLTPRQTVQALPSSSSHPRSDDNSHNQLTPGPSHQALRPANDEHTLDRIPSNLSLRSAGSYSKYDPKSYIDPAYFFTADTDNPGASGTKDGSQHRTHSRASTSPTLSYIN